MAPSGSNPGSNVLPHVSSMRSVQRSVEYDEVSHKYRVAVSCHV